MSALKNKRVKSIALSLAIFSQLGIISHAAGVYGVERIQGENIYETSAMLSEHFGEYDTAILVNLDNTNADGLSASGLSGAANAPIFAIKKDSIPYDVSRKVNSRNIKKVYIIGGENAISKKAIDGLYYGQEIIRLYGDDRIQTSYKVAEEINNISGVNKVFYANAWKGEADTMSIASVSARDKAPIIQTNGQDVPFTENIESYVIGGNIAMSQNIVNKTQSERLGGIDRF
ncbi:cell wall-binding repeat-containing protein, partial [Romboutsia ilealis]